MKAFSIADRLKSVRHALRGLAVMIRSQHNAWVHAVATAVVISAGLYFELQVLEWQVLILAMVAVWVSESLNTAFEFICDVASPEFHPLVEKGKDVAAGAVLLSALGAVVIGVMIFGPKLLGLVGLASL
jgi:diacylglycerol kinase